MSFLIWLCYDIPRSMSLVSWLFCFLFLSWIFSTGSCFLQKYPGPECIAPRPPGDRVQQLAGRESSSFNVGSWRKSWKLKVSLLNTFTFRVSKSLLESVKWEKQLNCFKSTEKCVHLRVLVSWRFGNEVKLNHQKSYKVPKSMIWAKNIYIINNPPT